MKKKDLIFYAGTAVLFAFSTQQVKADEQHASDQTPENTSAIVATTTSSEAQNTVSEGVGDRERYILETLLIVHNVLIINANWNGKITKETKSSKTTFFARIL